MSSPPFDAFLLELAKIVHFQNLASFDCGVDWIQIYQENIPLLLEFDTQFVPHTLLLSTPIAAIPMSHRENIYESLMIDNHTIEETLSAKPDEDLLYLHTRFHSSIQAIELEALIKIFIKNVVKWKSKIEVMVRESPKPSKIPAHPYLIQVFPYKV